MILAKWQHVLITQYRVGLKLSVLFCAVPCQMMQAVYTSHQAMDKLGLRTSAVNYTKGTDILGQEIMMCTFPSLHNFTCHCRNALSHSFGAVIVRWLLMCSVRHYRILSNLIFFPGLQCFLPLQVTLSMHYCMCSSSRCCCILPVECYCFVLKEEDTIMILTYQYWYCMQWQEQQIAPLPAFAKG